MRWLPGLLCALYFTGAAASEGGGTPPPFPEAVAEIDAVFTQWRQSAILGTKMLPYMAQFLRLSKASNEHVDDCVNYLAEPGHTRQQRQVATLSMKSLTLKNFIKYANGLYNLRIEGKLTTSELVDSIILPPRVSSDAYKYSLDGEVRELLYKISELNDLSSIDRNHIRYFLFDIAYFDYWIRWSNDTSGGRFP